MELLKKLWADGSTASRIAAELGKVHRLGLSGRAKSASASVPRQCTHRHMMRLACPGVRGNAALASMQVTEIDHEPEPQIVENIIPMGQRSSIQVKD